MITRTVKHLLFNLASGSSLLRLLVVPACISGVANAYDVLTDYSGQNFFNGWNFYDGWDNLTRGRLLSFLPLPRANFGIAGDAWYLDQQSASQQQLAYVNAQGNAIIKVDNSTNLAFGEKRNSVSGPSSRAFRVRLMLIHRFE